MSVLGRTLRLLDRHPRPTGNPHPANEHRPTGRLVVTDRHRHQPPAVIPAPRPLVLLPSHNPAPYGRCAACGDPHARPLTPHPLCRACRAVNGPRVVP